MMPVIRISDATFADLKLISTWMETKTPSQTIEKVINETMESLGLERDGSRGADSALSEAPDAITEYENVPPVTFTKILGASLNGKSLTKVNWNSFLAEMISTIAGNFMNLNDLVRGLEIPSVVGEHNADGYKFYPDLGISVQGQSAFDALKEAKRLSQKHNIPMEIEFQWHDKPRAYRPGQRGVVKWK